VLGEPPVGTPAALAGIRSGETVVSINDEQVESFQDLHWLALKHAIGQDSLRVETVDADNHLAYRTLAMGGQDESFEQSPLKFLGLVRYLPAIDPILGDLVGSGAASRGGLQSGDRVLAIDGQAIKEWDQVVAAVRAAPGKPLRFLIERQGTQRELTLVPEKVEGEQQQAYGRIGAAPRINPDLLSRYQGVVRYDPVDALSRAASRTWELSVFSLEMLGRMIVGQVSIKNLSGPITIADYAGQSAQTGLASFTAFLALVSVSLGVLNLLPVPLLDGGHLLYYFAEFFTGRPVSERIQEIGQKIGIGLLTLLMFFALYNDIQRLFVG
jgi:regulator of sigma E protease